MRSQATPIASDELLQLVTFRLGAEEYAVGVAQVQEIVRLTAITAVPRSPACVEGVINLRGRIVPVIDLARRFGLPAQPRSKDARIIITSLEGRTVGMLVDAVAEVLRLPASAIEPPPEVLAAGISADFLRGIGQLEDRLLILLDLPRLLTSRESGVLGAMVGEG